MYNDLPMGFLPHGNRAVVYHNRDIGKPEIQAVLAASKPRERAFFSFMVQSGLRPETVCMLQFKDLEPFDKTPCKVTVKKEKSKGHYADYFTFIAEDAVKYLQDYLSTRIKKTPEDFLFTNLNETGHLHRSHPSRYFQETASKLRTAGKVQYETKVQGKPSELRLYNLRKYFRKMAYQSGGDFCNFWMGHALPQASDKAYFPRDGLSLETVEIHRKVYAEKAMPNLRIESALPSETEAVIKEQAKQIGQLQSELAALKTEQTLQKSKDDVIQELMRKMEKMEETVQKMKRVLDTKG
jgi:integrase